MNWPEAFALAVAVISICAFFGWIAWLNNRGGTKMKGTIGIINVGGLKCVPLSEYERVLSELAAWKDACLKTSEELGKAQMALAVQPSAAPALCEFWQLSKLDDGRAVVYVTEDQWNILRQRWEPKCVRCGDTGWIQGDPVVGISDEPCGCDEKWDDEVTPPPTDGVA